MNKKYSIDQQGLVEICTDIKKIPIEKQPYYHMELASLGTQERKKSGRSVDQIRMYWNIVEALMYYTNTGIVDKDVMHQYLKEVYASTHKSSKYFHRIKHSNGKTRLICTFAVGTQSAIDFSNCSQALFNSYMDFVEKYIIDNTSFHNVEEILDAYGKVI